MVLPGDAGAASAAADWIVGARPGAAADAIAARHGAHRIGTGSYVVARGRARELVERAAGPRPPPLRRAEPAREALQTPAPDPLDARAAWRAAIVDPASSRRR